MSFQVSKISPKVGKMSFQVSKMSFKVGKMIFLVGKEQFQVSKETFLLTFRVRSRNLKGILSQKQVKIRVFILILSKNILILLKNKL